MRPSAVIVVSAACLAFASQSRAEGPPAGAGAPRDAAAEATAAYCRHARAVAVSNSALLYSPQLFVTGGFVTSADLSSGVLVTSMQPRILAGAAYSVGSLVRGIHTERVADAECERYGSVAKLMSFVFAHRDGASPGALGAKLAVLEASMARAEQILARARADYAASRATVTDLDAVSIRVDTLRAAVLETRAKLRVAAEGVAPPSEPLPALIARRTSAERAAEERAAALRQSYAWDIAVKGGYDQMTGIKQSVPAFATISLTFTPGYFWQTGADRRAVDARGDIARTGLEATTRAKLVAAQLSELLRSELERLGQLAPLLAELETRQREVAAVDGDQARAAADALWLAIVPLRAEDAYLRAHVADLKKTLGSPAGQAPRQETRRTEDGR